MRPSGPIARPSRRSRRSPPARSVPTTVPATTRQRIREPSQARGAAASGRGRRPTSWRCWAGATAGSARSWTIGGRKDEARPVLDRAVALTRALANGIPESGAGRARVTGLPPPGRAAPPAGPRCRGRGRLPQDDRAGLGRSAGRWGLETRAGRPRQPGQPALLLTGRPGEAERAFREAVGLYESLVDGDPERAGLPPGAGPGARQPRRAGGGAARRPARGRAAVPPGARAARPARGRLARRARFREELAATLLELADVLAAAGRPADARPLAERAVVLSEELVSQRLAGLAGTPPAAHPGARPPGRAPAGHRPAGGCRARTPPRRRAPRGDGRRGTRRARRRRRDRLGSVPAGRAPGGAGRPRRGATGPRRRRRAPAPSPRSPRPT